MTALTAAAGGVPMQTAAETGIEMASKAEMLQAVAAEHAEEASFLWLQRGYAVHAPNYSPRQFADLDERLAAQLDGLRLAGDEGWKVVEAALGNDGAAEFFAAAVLALEAQDGRFDALIERARRAPEALPGLISALGWVSSRVLDGRLKALLEDASPSRQKLGVAACALHRQDPGAALDRCLASPAAAADSVRIRALRAAGELGRRDLLPQCQTALAEAKPELRFWASWSAVLLGDRGKGLESLAGFALKPGPRQVRALQLALQALDTRAGHALLAQLVDMPDALRLRILGAGIIGDPRYAPWLIQQMAELPVARIAAEAFVHITGADFGSERLGALRPEAFEDGPADDPDDDDVELAEDIALPWPDVARVQQWWAAHEAGFDTGVRLFIGRPVTREHCLHVLTEGYQRQRVAAAHHLALLHPGTRLFPVAAPAWRQQRWLAKAG